MIQTRTLARFPRLKASVTLSRLTALFSSRRLSGGPDADQLWLLMIAGSNPETAAVVYDQMQEAQR